MPDDLEDLDNLTRLLNRLSAGDRSVENRVYDLVYGELKGIARLMVSREFRPHSANATDLLHNTYKTKLRNLHVRYQDRAHFYSLAAHAMRQALVDEVRKRNAQKRCPPDPQAVDWRLRSGGATRNPQQVLYLSPLLDKLEKIDPRAHAVVDLMFFLGLSLQETAEMLGLTVPAVRDDWDFAKAWIRRKIMNAKGTASVR